MNITYMRPKSVVDDANNVALIRRTVARDCNPDEFDMFVSMARSLQLDPLRKQIYAFVYNKADPAKRKLTLVVGIDGFRTIADRTGCYRPDEDPPTYEISEAAKGPTNPVGLISARVRVFKFAHSAWHRVTAEAYWDEYAPIKDEWAYDEKVGKRQPTGRLSLDTSGNWGKMPRLMLAKVAEALALRKAWPDAFSGILSEDEAERSRVIDASASEMADAAEAAQRQARLGGPSLTIDWLNGAALDGVPIGQFMDRSLAWIEENRSEPSTVMAWLDRNRHAFKEFWAHNSGDALELKKRIEAISAPVAG